MSELESAIQEILDEVDGKADASCEPGDERPRANIYMRIQMAADRAMGEAKRVVPYAVELQGLLREALEVEELMPFGDVERARIHKWRADAAAAVASIPAAANQPKLHFTNEWLCEGITSDPDGEPAAGGDTPWKVAALRLFEAVRGLGEIKDGKTFFELSPTQDEDVCRAWMKLNDAQRDISDLALAEEAK